MATKVEYLRNGIKIQCSTSRYPAPRPKGAWPVPAFNSAESSLISLTLVPLEGTAIGGILVASTGSLPGGSPGISSLVFSPGSPRTSPWTLYHRAYQGSPASLPAPVAIPLTLDANLQFSMMIPTPMPGATHVFWLRRVEGGRTTDFPSATISTPADPTQETLADLQQAAIDLATAANAAMTAASTAQSTADGKIVSFYQATPPGSASEGDLWFDTDDGNKLYTRRSGAWVATQDSGIATAIAAASTAQGTADGKAQIYYQTSAPTGLGSGDQGDLWVDTDNSNKLWAWTGSAWVVAQDWYFSQMVATKALTSGSNLIPNGDSELGALAGTPGAGVWDTFAATGANKGYLQTKYVRRLSCTGSGTLRLLDDNQVRVSPGERYVFKAKWNRQFNSVGTSARLALWFLNSLGQVIDQNGAVGAYEYLSDAYTRDSGTGGVWDDWYPVGPVTAPPNAASLMVEARLTTSSGTVEMWWDDVHLERLSPIPAAGSNTLGLVKVGNGLVMTGESLGVGPTVGTVLSASVVSANGFSGSVANAGTTPAITVTCALGAGVVKSNGTGSLVLATAGVDFLTPSTAVGPQSYFKNLVITTTGTNANVTATADQVILYSGSAYLSTAVNNSLAMTTTGAGGLDTGSVAASTWYSIWVISNGSTTALLASLSATAPTMPSGYTYKARIGWIKTLAASPFYPRAMRQVGRVAKLTINPTNTQPLICGGAAAIGNPTTGPTFVAQTVRGGSSHVPSTAGEIMFLPVMTNATSNCMIIAPTTSYAAWPSNSNPSPLQICTVNSVSMPFSGVQTMTLEADTIQVASQGNGYVYLVGWVDNL